MRNDMATPGTKTAFEFGENCPSFVRNGFDERLRDWLGGLPYECASAGAVFEYVHGRLGLELRYLHTPGGCGRARPAICCWSATVPRAPSCSAERERRS